MKIVHELCGLKSCLKFFTTADDFINTPEFYTTHKGQVIRLGWCTRKAVSVVNNEISFLKEVRDAGPHVTSLSDPIL